MDASERPVYREPTNPELRELERIGERRAELEAVEAGDEHQAAVRRLLLETLDEMEEALCLYGRRARAVTDGWRRLAGLESPRRANREP
jgi:hypothetical protein